MPINPALAHLEALVGHWRMELYRAAFLPEPETRLTGSIDIEWIAEGAALLMRQGDAAQPPAATWIVGRDAAEPSCSVLYADDRGVSRIYAMSFENGHWRMWRDTPEFSQRFHAELDDDGQAIRGRWEKSSGGAVWEHDFNVDYIRQSSLDPNQ